MKEFNPIVWGIGAILLGIVSIPVLEDATFGVFAVFCGISSIIGGVYGYFRA